MAEKKYAEDSVPPLVEGLAALIVLEGLGPGEGAADLLAQRLGRAHRDPLATPVWENSPIQLFCAPYIFCGKKILKN